MGADEEGTLAALKAIRRELFDPKIAERRGRIVKTTGDGMLVEFQSVVDAVRCAAEVQRGIAERNADVPESKRIEFRVGINLGDIIVDDDDIFGDGVNIAARLEALAEPGGICVSRVVRDQVRDKLAYSFADMGEQNVKNIARPVRAYAVTMDAAPSALPAAARAPTDLLHRSIGPRHAVDAPPLSIVVLPFANLSNDPEQEYFADAITEDLTTDLSRIANSFVIARSTAFSLGVVLGGDRAGDGGGELCHRPLSARDGRSRVLPRDRVLHDLLVPVPPTGSRYGRVFCGRRFSRYSRRAGIGQSVAARWMAWHRRLAVGLSGRGLADPGARGAMPVSAARRTRRCRMADRAGARMAPDEATG